MASITTRFMAAVGVTLMDVTAAACCAPVVWRAWSVAFWSRTGLLALAGGMAFTLVDIWSQTLSKAPLLSFEEPRILCELPHTECLEQMEGADV